MFQTIVTQNTFSGIQTTSDWWDWALSTIVNELRVASMYNGQPPYGYRGYLGKCTVNVTLKLTKKFYFFCYIAIKR